jgi:type IX secretion system PorP/SprF family membrane protein
MKKLFTILLALHIIQYGRAQHNGEYLQYMFNPLLINPAYAGSQDALNLTGIYRNQWLGIEGAPVTISFGAHTPLKNKKVNLGVIFVNDRYGIFNHQKINLVYAYRLRFLKGKLSFGLQAGIDSYSSSWSRINTIQKNDPNFIIPPENKILPDAGFGTYYHSRNFYAGFSVPRLINEYVSQYHTVLFHTGGILHLPGHIDIKPAFLAKYISSSPLSVNFSSVFYYKDIVGLGAGYTYNTSVLALADLKVNDQLRFGYGYEYVLNQLQTYSGGSHEITLRYLFLFKVESVSTRYF